MTRMEATLRQNLTWPNLRKDVEEAVKNCHECQIGKKVRNKYGDLPEKLAERPIAWNIVDVDILGPLTLKTPSRKKELLALTMIDPSTGWFEVEYVKDKSVKESMDAFDGIWLSRYPIPDYIGFDNRGEYKKIFEELVNNYDIKKNNSTPFNTQSNGIIEIVHLTLNDVLPTAEIDGRELDDKDPWGPLLSSAAYAIHITFHTTLKATPGQLVVGRDMVMTIHFLADWRVIEQQRQKEMGRNNRRENVSIISHAYKVGDTVLLKKPGKHLRKLEAPRTRPHTVTAVLTNGTQHIQNGKVNERVNIRRFFPCFENTDH
jgi:hypothetical protein